MRMWIAATMLVLASSTGSFAQDAGAGEQLFKRQCFVCHAVGEGAKVKLGPPLNGLEGRAAGTLPGYNFSTPMKSSGITWDEQSFKDYIRNPMAKVPGTRMVFTGVKSEQDAASLWAYLKKFGSDGKTK